MRFPTSAKTAEEARAYYKARAIQLLHLGWTLDGLKDLSEGVGEVYAVEATFTAPNLEECRSLFVLEGFTGKRLFRYWVASSDISIVTSSRCAKMVVYLESNNIPHTKVALNYGPCVANAYRAVESFYGDRKAKRSGQFYMNHIDEGLYILRRLGANDVTLSAWCLHPLLQTDEALDATLQAGTLLAHQSPAAVALCMEYRHRANAHLPKDKTKLPKVGVFDEVRLMLIADKVQNRKDFEVYLRGADHTPNSERLDSYFDEWFAAALGVGSPQYAKWVNEISSRSMQSIEMKDIEGVRQAYKPFEPHQAWNECEDDGTFAECPSGSPCSGGCSKERERCFFGLGFCRGLWKKRNGLIPEEKGKESL